MSYSYQPTQSYNPNPQNLQFYPSSYNAPVSGHTTPSQAQYGNTYGSSPHTSSAYGAGSNSAYGAGGFGAGGGPGFGAQAGISGRMGEQGGLRMGWLAAFGTEGYDGEPPLLEELGVNFEHIKMKVRWSHLCFNYQRNIILTNMCHEYRPSQFSTPSRASTNTSWTTPTSRAPSSSSSSSAPSCSSAAKSTSATSTASPSSDPSPYTGSSRSCPPH